jgi:hypothetical protein
MLQPIRMCVALGVALLVCAWPPASRSGPAEDGQEAQSHTETVAGLVAQLGSPRFGEREAASGALDALGRAALEPLQSALTSPDAEVRRRARQLVQKIERDVETARLLEPSRVRLVYRDTPVSQALADIARGTGLPIQLKGERTRPTERKVTVDTGEMTLWEALARFCQEAGLVEDGVSPGPFHEEEARDDQRDRRVVALEDISGGAFGRRQNQLVIRPGRPRHLPTYQAGALRVRALPPDPPPAGPPVAEGETWVGLEVRLEPRLRLQSVLGLRVDRALDDQGRALTQRVASLTGADTLGGGSGTEVLVIWDGVTDLPTELPSGAACVPIQLRLPDRSPRRLKELSGTIALRVLTAPEPLVTVERPLQSVGQTSAGADGSALRVSEARRGANGQLALRVEVTPAPRDLILGGVPARVVLANRGWRGGPGMPVPPAVGVEQLALVDARGRPLPLVGSKGPTIDGLGKAWEFTLVYQPGPNEGEPARLVYTGRRSATATVSFTLADIPLP